MKLLLILLFFINCTPDGPGYIRENEARQRLYLIAIGKCSLSGVDPSTKAIDIFAFVEKQFKTNTLSEGDRKKVVYYSKDFQKCESIFLAAPIEKCDFKNIDLINLISKGGLCKLEPASYYNF
jgi:hypothetical protein